MHIWARVRFETRAGSKDYVSLDIEVFDNFEDVLAAAIDEESNIIIKLNTNNSINLRDILISDLHTDDFNFAQISPKHSSTPSFYVQCCGYTS